MSDALYVQCNLGQMMIGCKLAEIAAGLNTQVRAILVEHSAFAVDFAKSDDGYLSVFITAMAPAVDIPIRATFDLLGRTDDDSNSKSVSFTHTYKKDTEEKHGIDHFILWEDVLANHVEPEENGEKGEVIVIMVTVEKVMPSKFDNIVYADLILTCDDGKSEFKVNKCVVAIKSELLKSALGNEETWETKGVFPINHPSATAEIVELVLRFIYDGYNSSKMYPHALAMLQLGDYLLADVVVDIAIDALERQLTEYTFWTIISVAAQLPNRSELLESCARFASTPSLETLFMLMNRPEGVAIANDKENDTIRVLNVAIAKLKEEN